jgi:hypothetical protein
MNINENKIYEPDLGYLGLIVFFIIYFLGLLIIPILLKSLDYRYYYDIRLILRLILSSYVIITPIALFMGVNLFLKIKFKHPFFIEKNK